MARLPSIRTKWPPVLVVRVPEEFDQLPAVGRHPAKVDEGYWSSGTQSHTSTSLGPEHSPRPLRGWD
eukprot:6962199-Prymnesium_polylepis.2